MRPYSVWRTGLPFYAPPIAIGAAVLAIAPGSAIGLGFGVVLVAAGAFSLYFFRDPERTIPADDAAVVSPADGTVVAVEDLDATPHYEGKCRRVSIFLSIFNVHINRAPYAGTVTAIAHQPGQFKNAMRADTTDCNEANTIQMRTDRGAMTVRQIAGLVARRIVCVCGVGDRVEKGRRMGMIRFGSRTELYLPPNTEICVRVKEKVYGGATVIARLAPSATRTQATLD
jgi:phosphatidylserine decarboxylase